MTELGIEHVLVTGLSTLLIAVVKGAFGGGFGLVGIPLMSLVMDPITAGAIVAPLFIPMDVMALRYFPPRTWSAPDVKILVPTAIVGIVLGTLMLSLLDTRLVSIVIAVVALAFAVNWYAGGQKIVASARKTWHAVVAGIVSGITTMVAHSGGPPLALYLLRLGLAKDVYVGTTTIYFLFGNAVKVWPWLYLGQPTAAMWTLIAICTPIAMFGVWLGWLVHGKLDQRRMYQGCYFLLVLASIKMLWDGLRGFF
jgi:uncharacterized membrane protein YfcA